MYTFCRDGWLVGEVKKVIQWFNSKKSLDFEIEEGLAGGASYDKHGTPITDEVFYKALESEAVILGAVGGSLPLYTLGTASIVKLIYDLVQKWGGIKDKLLLKE